MILWTDSTINVMFSFIQASCLNGMKTWRCVESVHKIGLNNWLLEAAKYSSSLNSLNWMLSKCKIGCHSNSIYKFQASQWDLCGQDFGGLKVRVEEEPRTGRHYYEFIDLRWPNFIKLFTFVIYKCLKLAGVFVRGKHFQPSVIFLSKVGAYLSEHH